MRWRILVGSAFLLNLWKQSSSSRLIATPAGAKFYGIWEGADGGGGLISGTALQYRDGNTDTIVIMSPTMFQVQHNGYTSTCVLHKDGRLRWNDGRVWNKVHQNKPLGYYTKEEVVAASRREDFMMLIQADLKKLLRLRCVLRAEFDKTFSETFSWDQTKTLVTKKATIGAVGVVALGDVALEFVANGLDQIGVAFEGAGAADTVLGMVLTTANTSESAEKRSKKMLEKKASFVKDGARMRTGYWPDIARGRQYDAYLKVYRAQRNFAHYSPKITTEVTPMVRKTGHPNPPQGWCAQESERPMNHPKAPLPPGTAVRFITDGGAFEERLSYDPFQDATKEDCVRIRWRNRARGSTGYDTGFVHFSAVSIRDWRQYIPKGMLSGALPVFPKLPVFPRPGEDEMPDPKHKVAKGEFIVVVEEESYAEYTALRLADGRGWVRIGKEGDKECAVKDCALYSALRKIGATHEEFERQIRKEEAHGDAATVNLMKLKDMYRSNWCFAGRFLLKGGLFAGGFFTLGVTWIIGAVIGVVNATTASMLQVAESKILDGNLGFMMGILASYEREAFSGQSERQKCDIVEFANSDPGTICPLGHTCLIKGVFVHDFEQGRENDRTSRFGYCFANAQRQYDEGQMCDTEFECKSGYCNMRDYAELLKELGKADKQNQKLNWWSKTRTEAVALALTGICRTPCDPGSKDCENESLDYKFGLRKLELEFTPAVYRM